MTGLLCSQDKPRKCAPSSVSLRRASGEPSLVPPPPPASPLLDLSPAWERSVGENEGRRVVGIGEDALTGYDLGRERRRILARPVRMLDLRGHMEEITQVV